MHIVLVLCVGMVSCKNLLGTYYGPYYPGSTDVIQARLMHESIQSTKSLERTIASRPHVQTSNYYHQDHSTNMSVNSGNGTIKISHTAGKNSSEIPSKSGALDPSSSWWQRFKRFIYPSRTDQKPSGYFSNKWDIAYKAMLISYAYINFRLFRLSMYLQDTERWYFWKQELPLAQLITMSQKDLAQVLVADVRQRYGTSNSTENSADANPFGIFMKVLEEEVAMLNSYQTFSTILLKIDVVEQQCLNMCCNYMPKVYGFSLSYFMTCIASKIRVKTIFYLDDALLQTVQERLSRLAYVKTVFVNWLAEHKLYVAKKMLHKGIFGLRDCS